MNIKTLGDVHSDNNPFHTVFGDDGNLSNPAKKLRNDEIIAYASHPGLNHVQLVLGNADNRSRLVINP